MGSDSTDLHALVRKKLGNLHKKDATATTGFNLPRGLKQRVAGIKEHLKDEDVKFYVTGLISPMSRLPPTRERASFSVSQLQRRQQLAKRSSGVANSMRDRGTSMPPLPHGYSLNRQVLKKNLVGRSLSATTGSPHSSSAHSLPDGSPAISPSTSPAKSVSTSSLYVAVYWVEGRNGDGYSCV